MDIEIFGLNTHYTAVGTENALNGTVLLLHGWGCDITIYDSVIKHLEPFFAVYALDMPGFGKTDEPANPWNMDNYADFVLEFCAKLGINDIVPLGHSFGGRVIIKMLTRTDCPLNVKKIILTGSAGIKPKQSFRAKMRTKKYKAGKKLLSLGPVKKIFPDALENSRKKHGSADYNAASPVMRRTLVNVVNEDLTALLPLIKQSALLFWGENDDATPLSDGKKMEQLINDSGLVVAKNAGHYAFLEQQGLFFRVIDSFLEVEKR